MSTNKTAREKQREYAKKLASRNSKNTGRARVPIASTSRRVPTVSSQSSNQENISSSSNLRKRPQPSSKRTATVAKRPRVQIASRGVSRQASNKLAEIVEDKMKQQYLALKKQVAQLEENSESLSESLTTTDTSVTEVTSNIQTKTKFLSDEQLKQIQLEGERDRLRIESQQKQETTNLLQMNLKDTRDRLTCQLDAEEAKYEALSYTQKSLQEQHSLTSSRLSDAKTTITRQEKQMSTQKTTLSEFSENLKASQQRNRDHKVTMAELTSRITNYEEQIQQLEAAARNDELMRRQLHDTILDLKGTVRVFIRVCGEESNLFEYPDPWRGQTLQMNPNADMEKMLLFEFDKVFAASDPNEKMFNELQSLICSSVEGDFVNILAYSESVVESPIQSSSQFRETICYALSLIMEQTEKLKRKGWSFSVAVNCVSIQNENFHDVLTESEMNSNANVSRKTIRDVNYVNVENVRDFEGILDAYPSPDLLQDSTVVLQVHMDAENNSTGEASAGLLNIVSLASPTSDKDSKSTQSLTNVITSIANQDNVSFRQSKLTNLLHESLSNENKTLFVVQLTPFPHHVPQHLSALRFAKEINSCNIGQPVTKTKGRK